MAAGGALGVRRLCGITGRNSIRPPPCCGVDARDDDGVITEEPALLGTILVVRLGAAGVLRLGGSSLMAGRKKTRRASPDIIRTLGVPRGHGSPERG